MASLALVDGPAPPVEHRLDGAGPGRRVLTGVHELLASAGLRPRDLRRIVVGVGPGGFTGVRIGIATALGLGQALDVPVVGASSLRALATGIAASCEEPTVAAVTDARRGEVFAAAYARHGGDLREVLAPGARRPEDLAVELLALGGPVALGGTGVAVHRDALTGPGLAPLPDGSPGHVIRASALVELVDRGHVLPARPDYHRLPDAEVNRLARAGGAGS